MPTYTCWNCGITVGNDDGTELPSELCPACRSAREASYASPKTCHWCEGQLRFVDGMGFVHEASGTVGVCKHGRNPLACCGQEDHHAMPAPSEAAPSPE
jgi:hypothetical protein